MDASTTSGARRGAFERRADLTEDLAMARVRGRLFAQAPAVVRVGRYLVLERLGRGAHGEVHRAWDERLERTVALKLVRPRSAADGRALLDEARALARLVHPNVVALFDADELPGGEVYLAMELVAGGSLGDWLARSDARPRDIVRLLHGAAQGLHAAHVAGLVHRDIKPENLLITSDGRLEIADFGLARILGDGDRDEPLPPLVIDDSAATETTSPRGPTSAFAGTPRYMAPEQHLGLTVDPRSDQYAFCAVAWLAFTGHPPFLGDTRDALLAAKRRGPDPAAAAGMPPRIRRALLRGLAFDPAQRHADVSALVAVLDPSRTRRWLPAWLVVGGAGVGALMATRADPAACDGGAQHLQGVFDASRRAAIAEMYATRPEPYASTTWDSTAHALAAWIAQWQAAHLELCEAHRRGETSAPLHDARMACLAQRRGELAALVERLAQPDAAVVERALSSVHALPAARSCRAATIDDAGTPVDSDDAERVRGLVAAADAAASTGAYPEARTLADAALAEVERRMPDAWRWRGAALLARGRARSLSGDAAGARDDLEAAARAARRAADELGFAAAATELVWEHGEIAGAFPLAHLWADFAQVALERAGDDDTIALLLANARGAVATNEHRFELAMLHHVVRLDRIARVWGPDDGRSYASLANLGNVAWARGRPADALDWYTDALAVGERTLGQTHPRVLALRGNVVGVLRVLGRHAEALAEADEVLGLQHELLGPTHPDVAATLVNLQTAAQDHGDRAAAIRYGTRAVAIIEATAGPHARLLVPPLTNLAIERALEGDVAQGRADLARAFAVQRATHGPGHGDEVPLLRTAGELELAAGQPAAAARQFAQMRALAAAIGGEDSADVALAEVQWARAELAAGDITAARTRLATALPRLEAAARASPRDLEHARALQGAIVAAAP
jgi:tetratricopeptide (TPR) repeat protein